MSKKLDLPIRKALPDILDVLKKKDEVTVIAPTGTGKSLEIPASIIAQDPTNRVMVCVPVRSAALNLYDTQVEFRPELKVGYAADRVINYDDTTQVIYATYQHVTNLLFRYFTPGPTLEDTKIAPIDFATHIMLDESHTGNIELSKITALLNYARHQDVVTPKIVIATATPAPDGIFIEVPQKQIITVEVKSPYERTYIYADRSYDSDEMEELLTDISVLVLQLTDRKNGIILVFLPGEAEIGSLAEILDDDSRLDVLRYHSSLDREVLGAINTVVPAGKVRVILSTNALETGVTIPGDVGVIIDSMYERRSIATTSGATMLITHLISNDSAVQRAGRTGRTRDGTVYRMIRESNDSDDTSAKVFDQLEQHRPVDLFILPLHGLAIQFLARGLDPVKLFPVVTERLGEAISLLQQLHMLTEEEAVTELGLFASRTELSVRCSAFLWNWIKADHPAFPAIVICCAIDSYTTGPFFVPRAKSKSKAKSSEFQELVEEVKEHHDKEFGAKSDIAVMLGMFINLFDYEYRGSEIIKLRPKGKSGFKIDGKLLSRWAGDLNHNGNSMNRKAVDLWLSFIKRTISDTNKAMHWKRSSQKLVVGRFEVKNVIKTARPIMSYVWQDRILNKTSDKGRVKYARKGVRGLYILDNRSVSHLKETTPEQILAVLTRAITGGLNVVVLGLDLKENTTTFEPLPSVLADYTKQMKKKTSPTLHKKVGKNLRDFSSTLHKKEDSDEDKPTVRKKADSDDDEPVVRKTKVKKTHRSNVDDESLVFSQSI